MSLRGATVALTTPGGSYHSSPPSPAALLRRSATTLARLTTGIHGSPRSGCTWYEGIEWDAVDEAEALLEEIELYLGARS